MAQALSLATGAPRGEVQLPLPLKRPRYLQASKPRALAGPGMRPLDVFAELLSPRCVLPPDDRLVLGALVLKADNATGDAGVLYVDTLMQMTGRSESTVQRSIRRLMARDLATRRKRKTAVGDHAPSAYALTLRWAGLFGEHAPPVEELPELDHGEELCAAFEELRALMGERNALHAQLVKVTAERDALRAMLREELPELPEAGEELPELPELPEAGEELPELPEAGEELPEAGEELPEAGEELPEAGEELPELPELPEAGEEPPSGAVAAGGGAERTGGLSGPGGGVREPSVSARVVLPIALPCASAGGEARARTELDKPTGKGGAVVPGPGMADALLRALVARPALRAIARPELAEYLSHAAAVVGLPLAVQAFDELAGKAGAAAAVGLPWKAERLAGAAWAFIEGKQEGRRTEPKPVTTARAGLGTFRRSGPGRAAPSDDPGAAWRADYDPAEARKTAAREEAWKELKDRDAADAARAAVIIAGRVPFMADWLEEQRRQAQLLAVENRAKRAEAERGRQEAERTAREEQQRRRLDAVTETFAPVVGAPRLVDGAWVVE